jgi:hypothetical protein
MRSLAACWRHPFECQFLQSGGGLLDVEISFRIDCNLMAPSDNARRLDVAYNLQRLAINNVNAIATADIQKLLGWVRRQRQVAGKRLAGSDQLLEEFAVFGKHLDAAVFPIGHIHGAIVGDADGVYYAELLGPGSEKLDGVTS